MKLKWDELVDMFDEIQNYDYIVYDKKENNFIFIDCKSLYNLRIFDIPALFISLTFSISKTTAGILIEQASSQSSTNFFISSGKTRLDSITIDIYPS